MNEGMKIILEKTVGANDTAIKVGSGTLEVFATPMMIAFMENTAFKLVEKDLKNGETTVGISVNTSHLKANLVGDTLQCEAVLVKIEGKKLSFQVKVTHNNELVGEGEHTRYIVNEEKFLGKIKG